jgi:mRNA-degrading endonuclease YafQ of YafQ-DinJ toxin-antitoxin module
VKRELLRSAPFVRAARRVVRRSPSASEDLRTTLRLLSEDAFDPRLRTHKLKGSLAGSWACVAGYDLRIVFSFVESEGKESILLETIGTHEEVY